MRLNSKLRPFEQEHGTLTLELFLKRQTARAGTVVTVTLDGISQEFCLDDIQVYHAVSAHSTGHNSVTGMLDLEFGMKGQRTCSFYNSSGLAPCQGNKGP